MKRFPVIIRTLLHVAILAFSVGPLAAADTGLDGAAGSIFKVNVEARSFELLKETEYDPQTAVGRSRFTVYWTDETVITKIEEKEGFAGIDDRVVAELRGIDERNWESMARKKPFIARVATLLPDATEPSGISRKDDQLSVWLIPDQGDSPRSGKVELDGEAVDFSLRDRNWRVFHHQKISPHDLLGGLWKTTIRGGQSEDRFIIGEMEVSPLVDPRTTDDPKLPRVLVIGDSISMNYHEAAKSALLGVANYHRNDGNSFSTVFGVRNTELWLGNHHEKGLHWDVIQFNHGLHDLKQAYDADQKSFGPHDVDLETYKDNLEKQIGILRETGATLVWCTTTPVPNDNLGRYARRKGASAIFNAAALEVMMKHPNILINDLHQVIDDSPIFDGWRKGTDVHFYSKEEQEALGGAVAAALRKALAARGD